MLEIHGNYDPINEFSTNSYPSVQQIKLLQNDMAFTVAEMMVEGKKLLIAQCNNDFEKNHKHALKLANIVLEWAGPYTVLYNGNKLN